MATVPKHFVRHIRLTLSGTLGDGSDIFSFGLSLAQQSQDWLSDAIIPDFPSDDIADDWRDASTAFFQRGASRIGNGAHLRKIVVAQIGSDGTYEHAPKEYGMNLAGGAGVAARFPWQVSQAVTLETNGDIGRVKGRFYLPLPDLDMDFSTDLTSQSSVEDIRGSAVTWINDLADQPGVDFADWRVVVASQGRYNANGSLRLAAANHDVQAVNVGRRPDVIRRRANKVSESRVSSAAVNQV